MSDQTAMNENEPSIKNSPYYQLGKAIGTLQMIRSILSRTINLYEQKQCVEIIDDLLKDIDSETKQPEV